MPWRDPSRILEYVVNLLVPLLVILVGVLYRMYEANGRQCITREQFMAELPGALVLLFVVLGAEEYMALGGRSTLAVAMVLGWLGPRIIVSLSQAVIDRVRGRGK